MNRVSGTEVKAIINTSLIAADVESFILAANAIVTARCSDYSVVEQKELERWLSAHLVSIRDPSRSAVIEQKAGSVEQKYQLTGKNLSGLGTTPYGQQVLILDYKKTLADLGKQTNTVFRTFGPENEDFA